MSGDAVLVMVVLERFLSGSRRSIRFHGCGHFITKKASNGDDVCCVCRRLPPAVLGRRAKPNWTPSDDLSAPWTDCDCINRLVIHMNSLDVEEVRSYDI